ncbi:NUDIX domain-containing protein [Pseudomonas tremae]|uniref:NUDIX domain-containing protein n=1 Tax=Pseudomonas coronafaciens pv. coronafaciens TaxID=235275 RepID=A0AAE6QG99_9PSED|nr:MULTISPECIES: NUDIX domain-containing protein [Pseudomonas syringae group]KPB54443.1 MutT/nudix family protein [Pseudomonas coronafaciens pv. oryzae]KPY05586.1 MutT/nudix family protein [Pseudomonas coronafaciens pv. oryzae]KPZ20611.1 MutT/nudix family protein [Pseudomonas coronafaciens pv. zizaniae]MCF5714387.1 NUDIX domain-containing protein [Pseudomonas tremae]MCF5743432.1 NUDIX domain-containing protein [Pseudomonas tremae]
MKVISIAAALLIGADGRTLLVRKRGTQAFMQPGGKIEPDEPAPLALARELEEELGLVIDPRQAAFLGEFAAPAANEPGFEVRCQLYEVRTDAEVKPAAEIEEAIWVGADRLPDLHLAPLTRDFILPLYRQRQADNI